MARRAVDERETAAAAGSGQALDLEGSIVVLVTMLANRLSASGSITFQKRHGLSSPEWKAMAVIAAMPGISGAEVAQVLGIDKAAVSRTVRTLSERGLVAIERRTGNFQAITLSDRGEALHAEALGTAAEREECLLGPLDAEARAALRRQLQAMMGRMPSVYRLADETIAVPAGVASMPSADEVARLRDRVARLERLLADAMLSGEPPKALG